MTHIIKDRRTRITSIFILVACCLLATAGNIHGQTWMQAGADLDGIANYDNLGFSVALSASGTVLATGTPGYYLDTSAPGRVEVFTWSGSMWSPMGANIFGAATGDRSGYSVDLNNDGTVLVIGSIENDDNGSNAGHVRVLEWNGATWEQKGTALPGEAAGDNAGWSVSIAADGNTVIVGAPKNDGNGNDAGLVAVYSWNGTAWVSKGSPIYGAAGADNWGFSVSLSDDGNAFAAGAPLHANQGQVKVYDWDGSAWMQRGTDLSHTELNGRFGNSVDLSSDGQVIGIGANLNNENGTSAGLVRCMEWNGSMWAQRGADLLGDADGDEFGKVVCIGDNGNVLGAAANFNDTGGIDAGVVNMFEWTGTAWAPKGQDIPGEAAGDRSGSALCLNAAGNAVAIGASANDGIGTEAGHVRVFSFDGTLAVSNQPEVQPLRLHPNPTNGQVALSAEHMPPGSIVRLLDLTGALVWLHKTTDYGPIRFFIEETPGLYTVQLVNVDGTVRSAKVVIE